MTERPILFSAPMVRAILDGRKTQTRRIAKPRRKCSIFDGSWSDAYVLDPGNDEWRMSENPYGLPGDRLWVRETWAHADARHEQHQPVAYRADGEGVALLDDRWRPSIHMPRWASRITLEVTEVRVERLHYINRGDAMEEGCPFPNMAHGPDPREWFRDLWQSINGPGSWDADPWVWVVGFRRVT